MSKSTDLIGQTFGKLTVVSKNTAKPNYWLCKCECGGISSFRIDRLKDGISWHCGCIPRQLPMDLTGQKFGRLTAIRLAPKTTKRNRWECLCDCGNPAVVDMGCLRDGNTMSCGCLQADIMRDIRITHGQSTTHNHSGAYRSWASMRERVLIPSCNTYSNYGGRGITIDPSWDDFSVFYADMGDRPKGHSIDRIDCNGNYEKSNCRWADRITQANNKRNNCRVYWNGEVKTIREWAETQGISSKLLYQRIYTYGWTVEKALTHPHRSRLKEAA